jgi:hypothetical protein
MLRLYCLPGRLALNLDYLFPRTRMEAITTARQRRSTFVQFIASTIIYYMLYVILFRL